MSARINNSSVVFLGDSLTEGFDLERYFPTANVVNRGLSGDTTYQVRYRMDEIVIANPAKLFLMIGINDLFQGENPTTVIRNIASIINDFKTHSPATEVFLLSILPVNESIMFADEFLDLSIYSLNDSLRIISKELKVNFLDLYADFLDEKGEMDRKYTYDGVHLSNEGYDLWAKLISPFVLK